MNYFLEIYGTLPRAGPGADEFTRRAYRMLPQVPAAARILDLGCGPGAQTVELLRMTAGTVVALDLLPEMLARVSDAAQRAGLSDRLVTVQQDMSAMDFERASFDIVWSEGAIYNLGFAAGIAAVQPLLKPGGYLVVSDVVWLKPDPPAEIVEFWREYPEIDTVTAKQRTIRSAGYQMIGSFVLPPTAWTAQYYDPMEQRIAEHTETWSGIPEAEEVLQEARNEITLFGRYREYYSYAFFVMRSN